MLRKQASEFEARVRAANEALAESQDVPDGVAALVRELADARGATSEVEYGNVDPYLVLALDRGVIGALLALEAGDAPMRRRGLRVGLEQIRQALRDIAEGEPAAEDVDAKAVAAWLDDVVDAPQRDVAELLGVSLRQWQRWVSRNDAAEPRGEDARRIRVLARVVANLRHVLTGAGVLRWFDRPVEGRVPRTLLEDGGATGDLVRLAARTRSHRAA